MMLDWNGYREELLGRTRELARIVPPTLRGYRQLRDAGAKSDLLGPKVRELIALAVGVTRQCDGCIAVHTEAAARQGATREEIAEALGVAISVNAGAALVYSARVLDACAAGADPGAAPA
jgi:AhpD family alkylhydroperoxidase